MHKYSDKYHEIITALSPEEMPLYCLRITHPLSSDVCIVNDNTDLTFNGQTYVACAFALTWPDDSDSSLPRAQIQIDNVGGLLTRLFEQTSGARGATVQMLEVLRSSPDFVERSITMDITSVSMNSHVVSLGLGFDDILNKPAIPATYRPPTRAGSLGFKGLF